MINVAHLTSQLVAIHTENPPGDTSDCAEFVRNQLQAIGLDPQVSIGAPGRANVIAHGSGAALLFCGHLEVGPADGRNWSCDPTGGEISDGYVWGRGATDMKGGCAAIIAACAAAANRGNELEQIGVAFVADEETGGGGIQHLIKGALISPCDCLIAEPTPEGSPCLGQKGLVRARFSFSGEPGHASLYPARGISAVMEAVRLIEHVQSLHEREFDPGPRLEPIIANSERVLEEVLAIPGSGPILRRLSYNPGRIEGGEKANIVAERCDLELDLRLPWGCDPRQLMADLQAHAPRASAECLSSSAPSFTDPNQPIVEQICAAIESVRKRPAIPIVQWAASDARALRLAGFPTVEYGPGDLSCIHGLNERVPVRALEESVSIYSHLVDAYT